MPTVIIAGDAAFRAAGPKQFREVCPECESERKPSSKACSCGHAFVRAKRSFFTLAWQPVQLELVFPQHCPHCGQAPTKTVRVSSARHTSRRRMSTLFFEVPVCRRVRHPLWYWLATMVGLFWTGVFGLMMLFGQVTPGIFFFIPFLGLTMWGHRSYTWLRFAYFDQRSVVFRVRRDSYARELALDNGGYIKGRLRR